MSLHPSPASSIPEETARIAHAAFPKGAPVMRRRALFGPLYSDPHFAALSPHEGQPADAPTHLALVTVRPFAEGLCDRQAADAVRARIDWT